MDASTSSTSTHANLSVETVEVWSVAQVKDFLNSKKDEFSLNDNEITGFEENGINGRAFLRYTEEKLLADNLRRGPASNIADFVAQLNNQSKFYHKIVYRFYASRVIQQASFKAVVFVVFIACFYDFPVFYIIT